MSETPQTPVCNEFRTIEDDISREKITIQDLKNEVYKIKGELVLFFDNQKKPSIEKNNLVRNLEAQTESLKEALHAESQLRVRVEEELDRVERELRFYKQMSPSQNTDDQIQELKNYYETELEKLRGRSGDTPKSNAYTNGGDHGLKTNRPPNGTDEVETKLCEMKLLYDHANRRANESEAEFEILRQKHETSGRMVNAALQKVAETLELARLTTDERDSAVTEKAKAEQELQRLRSVVETLVDEAGKRTCEEVEKLRELANSNTTKLLQDMHALEKERTKLATELEQMRERTEIHSPKFDRAHQLDRDSRVEQTLQRAHQAERERDELGLKLQACIASHERAILAKEDEIAYSKDEIKLMTNRLESAESQRLSAEQRLKQQLESVNLSEQKATEAKRQSETVQRSALQQIMLTHQAAELQEADSRRRMEALEKSSHQSTLRWQDLMAKQQKIISQWKLETQMLADQLEQQGNDLRTETNAHKQDVAQLTKRLARYELKRTKRNSI